MIGLPLLTEISEGLVATVLAGTATKGIVDTFLKLISEQKTVQNFTTSSRDEAKELNDLKELSMILNALIKEKEKNIAASK